MFRILPRFATALAVLVTFSLTACDFDGAYDLPLPGSHVDADEAYEVQATFDDVLNVVPKSPVMVDDVPVGEVTEVERDGWDARVTMIIREDVEVPGNAQALIRQTSLLGEKYISLEPHPSEPAVGQLADGDVIRKPATGRNPEVEEVLGALSFLLSGGGVAQLGTITTELNNVMNGRTDKLSSLLGTLDSVVGTIDAQKVDIINALESMNKLAKTLNKERRAIGKALEVTGPAVAVLRSQHKDLIKMLTSLDELGVVGTRVIKASRTNVINILKDLKPVLTKLDEAGKALPEGLSLLLSFPFPQEAAEIVKGDFGNTEIRLDINLENYLSDGKLIDIPDPGQLVKDLQACLTSGSLTGPECAKFLLNLDLFKSLKAACKKPVNQPRDVCKILRGLGPLADLDLGDVLGDLGLGDLGLGNLPGLPGLRRALTSGTPSSSGPEMPMGGTV